MIDSHNFEIFCLSEDEEEEETGFVLLATSFQHFHDARLLILQYRPKSWLTFGTKKKSEVFFFVPLGVLLVTETLEESGTLLSGLSSLPFSRDFHVLCVHAIPIYRAYYTLYYHAIILFA